MTGKKLVECIFYRNEHYNEFAWTTRIVWEVDGSGEGNKDEDGG